MDMELIPAPVQRRRPGDGAAVLTDRGHDHHAGRPGTEPPRAGCAPRSGPPRPAAAAPGAEAQRTTPSCCASTRPWNPRATGCHRRTGRSVVITGGSPAGVFWGAQTLRQLLGPGRLPPRTRSDGARRGRVPSADIEDAPRFAWRGMMLDVARHFMPKDGVLRYLDLLAAHKLNVLHFHLTDDQGWRVEIKRYPKLTEVGAWRARTKLGPPGLAAVGRDARTAATTPRTTSARSSRTPPSGTSRVVPEIDIPGPLAGRHRRLPGTGQHRRHRHHRPLRLGHLGRQPERTRAHRQHPALLRGRLRGAARPLPGRHLAVHPHRRRRVPQGPVEGSRPTAQARIGELGLADEDELQTWFIRHFDRWLAARGRRLIGWDEILEGGLAGRRGRVVLARLRGRHRRRRAGHDVVMCPEQQVYLDHRQDGGPDEPMPIGYVRTLEDVYRFEPVPPGSDRGGGRHVLGTQANVWTEVMENRPASTTRSSRGSRPSPRSPGRALPAPAERDFADFERRMTAHYARLDALGVEYRPPRRPAAVAAAPRRARTPDRGGAPERVSPAAVRVPATHGSWERGGR